MTDEYIGCERKINRLYTWKLLPPTSLLSQKDSRGNEVPIKYRETVPVKDLQAELATGSVIGVKEYYQFLDSGRDEAEAFLAGGEMTDDLSLRALGIRDFSNRNLTHIIHNPSAIKEQRLREILDSQTKRLAFTQTDIEVPNFYDKPTADYDALFKKAVLEVARSGGDLSVIRTQSVRHGEKARELLRLMKRFGLTRGEYVTLMTLSKSIEDMARDPRAYKEN